MAKYKETLQFHFYVIACFGKKNQPFKGDPAGRFVGYWTGCSLWKDIYKRRRERSHPLGWLMRAAEKTLKTTCIFETNKLY